jgi:hypothetical protein
MAYLGSLVTDVRAMLASTWTDCKANGIWEYKHIDMVPWAELTAPYAVMIFPDFQEDDSWGVTNDTYSAMCEFYYVGEDLGEASTQRTKIEAARDFFLQNTYLSSSGSIVALVTDLDFSDNFEPNVIFRDKNYTSRAGRFGVEFIVGQTQP